MDKKTKKNLGAFYTPSHTAHYMVGLLSNFNNQSKLLEPCGGDGVFVKEVVKRKLIKPAQIEVWDINPQVKKNLKSLGVGVKIKDSLLETDFQTLFKNSYTHIVSNPPYLNKQSQYLKQNKKKLRKLYKAIGVNDTYALFLYLACNLLTPKGELVFIISDTYRTLGIHKRLRRYLLKNTTINQITLCSPSLFNDAGISVRTSIIYLTNAPPTKNHRVIFNDCRKNKIGDYQGKIWKANQNDILTYPDYVFYFENNKSLMNVFNQQNKKLIDFLEGGLGMHTTNNKKFLVKIDYDQFIKNKDGNWRIYHKTGGDNQYYKKPGYAIKWDRDSVKHYKSLKGLERFFERDGFLISGVCSKLAARVAFKGALWESNKAFEFFPKTDQYPTYFFIGILNSAPYNQMIKIINHTNSIQIRDIKKLPMFDFKKNDIKKITNLTKIIVNKLKKDAHFNFSRYQKKIDQIVVSYIKN